jgi:hypothetical protein
MYRTIITVSAGVLLAASGVVHGLWTDRWTADPEELKIAAERLRDVPRTIGAWEGTDIEMNTDPRMGLSGVLARRYVHQQNGKVVTIYLACARPGPACVHTPVACYTADGYDEAESPRRIRVAVGAGAPAEFWTARFLRQRPDGQTHLRIFWAWHAADGWKVADNPRIAFAGESVLHKLYVIRELVNPNEPAEGDVCVEFIQALLPALEERLFVK